MSPQREGDRRAPVLGRRRTDDPQVRDLRQAPHRVLRQRVLVGEDLVHADRVQVVDRRSRDRPPGRSGACPPRTCAGPARRWTSASRPSRSSRRRRGTEAGPPAAPGGPRGTPMPVGPHILWPVKATKSAWRACTSSGMCGAAWEASMQTRAPTSWARRMIVSTGLTVPRMLDTSTKGDDLRLLGDDLLDVRQVEPAVVREAEPLQLRARALRQQLPRHDVGVVLHLRDDDLGLVVHPVGLVGPAQHVRHEVQRLGGVLGEDHLVAARRVDERGDLVARALVQRRGLSSASTCTPRWTLAL